MALSKDEVLDAIADMSVMDVVQLVKAMEEKFGVSAAAAVAAAPAAAGGGYAAPAEEKTEFDITSERRKSTSLRLFVPSLASVLKRPRGWLMPHHQPLRKLRRKRKQKKPRSSWKKPAPLLSSSKVVTIKSRFRMQFAASRVSFCFFGCQMKVATLR